jgi:hypothetical protein
MLISDSCMKSMLARYRRCGRMLLVLSSGKLIIGRRLEPLSHSHGDRTHGKRRGCIGFVAYKAERMKRLRKSPILALSGVGLWRLANVGDILHGVVGATTESFVISL